MKTSDTRRSGHRAFTRREWLVGTHFLGAAEEDAHLAGPHVAKELQLGGVAIVVLDELNLRRGNPARQQFVPHVLIDREASRGSTHPVRKASARATRDCTISFNSGEHGALSTAGLLVNGRGGSLGACGGWLDAPGHPLGAPGSALDHDSS